MACPESRRRAAVTAWRDAVIVGAGPAGSAAATVLARRGHRVTVVDRAKFPRDKPCGDYCDPGAERAFQDLGCLSEVLASGAVPIATMRVMAHDGSGFEAPFPSGRGLLIPRKRLDAALLAHAARAGAEVIEGFHVDGIRPEDEGIQVRMDHPHPRTVRARLVIAADGMRSTIAHRLGLRRLPVGRYTVGAYFSGLQGAPRGELHLGPGFYCGVANFGDGTGNVCMALPRSFLRRRSAERAFCDAVCYLPVLADTLTRARRESPFRCTGPVGCASRQVVADRTMLAGDAGGQIEPMTGQGIYMALRSGMIAAEVAAGALESGDLTRQALEVYSKRRASEFGAKLNIARLLQYLAFRPRLTPYLVRRLASRPALASQLLGVTGDVSAADAVFTPGYLIRLLAGA